MFKLAPVCLAVLLCSLIGGANSHVFAEDLLEEARIQGLLERLSHEQFVVRNRAAIELEKMLATDEPIWKARYLAHQTNLSDPEVRQRLEKMLLLSKPGQGQHYKILDAIGNPIPDLFAEACELPFPNSTIAAQRGKAIARSLTDPNGSIWLPTTINQGKRYAIRVYAPGYGIAEFIAPTFRDNRNVTLPLVSDDSEYGDRCIRGTIKDEAGKPVVGAILVCQSIRAAGGDLRSFYTETRVIADGQGKFRAYMSFDENKKHITPTSATMCVEVRVPGTDFFPQDTNIPFGTTKNIVLRQGKWFHKFEVQNLQEKHIPQLVFYSGDVRRGGIQLDPTILKDGGKLLAGRYSLSVHDQQYQTIQVSEESPLVLTFRQKLPPVFRGNVIDGITKNPFGNAFVFAYDGSSERQLSEITDDLLEEASDIDLENKDHKFLAMLGEVYGIRGITRTNDKGEFSLVGTEGGRIYGLIAWSAGMLPVTRRAPYPSDSLKVHQTRFTDMPMYRSARVKVTPLLSGAKREGTTFWPVWDIEDKDQPDWFAEFKDAQKSRAGIGQFYPCKFLVESGKSQHLLVPANLKMKLRLRPSYTDDWSPIAPQESFKLKPGQILDWGELSSDPTVAVRVKVTGPNGRLVEGCPVRHRYLVADSSWRIGVMTDATGIATIKVARTIKGEFGVVDLTLSYEKRSAKNLRVPFYVDAIPGNPFELSMTEEQIRGIRIGGPR